MRVDCASVRGERASEWTSGRATRTRSIEQKYGLLLYLWFTKAALNCMSKQKTVKSVRVGRASVQITRPRVRSLARSTRALEQSGALAHPRTLRHTRPKLVHYASVPKKLAKLLCNLLAQAKVIREREGDQRQRE